jgi:predicted deacylase
MTRLVNLKMEFMVKLDDAVERGSVAGTIVSRLE